MIEEAAIQVVLEDLSLIEKDMTIPKNVRGRIKVAMDILGGDKDKNVRLKIDKSVEELAEIADDPNIPSYTKMQIWSIVSQLERK